MSTSPFFGYDELPASSSQPEIYVNTNDRINAAMAQLRFADRDLSTPPGSPSDGDVYLIKQGATGAWAGNDERIAIYLGTSWYFVTPRPGYLAYVIDEDVYIRFAAGSPNSWITFP